MNQSALIAILGDRPIAYHPIIAKAVGSVNAGIFLSQLLYWQGKGANDEWTYKTQAEFEEETALSRREQEGARVILGKLGILEEDKRGTPCRIFYRINVNRLSRLLEMYNQECTKCANLIAQNVQTNTETTTETTTDISNNKAAEKDFSHLAVSEKDAAWKLWTDTHPMGLNRQDAEEFDQLCNEFPPRWVGESIRRANAAKTTPYISWRFVDAILKKWQRLGGDAPWERDRPVVKADGKPVTGVVIGGRNGTYA